MIKLLVVISIIALLIAILLPALAGAREAARTSQCLSNLRQNAIAMHTYSIDHDGTFYACIEPNSALLARHAWGPQLIRMGYLPGDWNGIETGDREAIAGMGVLKCPSLQNPVDGASRIYGMSTPDESVSSGEPGAHRTRRFLKPDLLAGSMYGSPTEYLLMADSYRPFATGAVQWYQIDSRYMRIPVEPFPVSGYAYVHARHNGGVNAAYADGHGRTLTPEAMDDPDEPDVHRFPVIVDP